MWQGTEMDTICRLEQLCVTEVQKDPENSYTFIFSQCSLTPVGLSAIISGWHVTSVDVFSEAQLLLITKS